MRKLFVVSLVAAFIVLGAGPAEALRKSKQGTHFVKERGSCQVGTSGRSAVVKCHLDEVNLVTYRFLLPRDARHVDVRWHRESAGCCGSKMVWFSRAGAHKRHIRVRVRAENYGNPLGLYKLTVHRVEVRYRT